MSGSVKIAFGSLSAPKGSALVVFVDADMKPAPAVTAQFGDLEPLIRMAPGARYAFRSDATHLRMDAETLPSPVGRALTTPFDILVDGRLALRADPGLGEAIRLDGRLHGAPLGGSHRRLARDAACRA